MHTFEEIRTRTPANPNKAAHEAALPQAACEALLRDAVQGFWLSYTPETFRRWLQTTQPLALEISAPQAPPHPTTTTGKRKGKVKARSKWARGGPSWQAGAQRDRAPGTSQHGGKKPPKGQEKEAPGAAALSERAQRRAPGRTHRKGTPQR